MTPNAADRFWRFVVPEPNSGCWLWDGAIISNGYGSFHYAGKTWRAHRFSWLVVHKREIPRGLMLDHKCSVRSCVNPDHLEPVTHAENIRRAFPGAHSRIHKNARNTEGKRKSRLRIKTAKLAGGLTGEHFG